MKTRAFRSLLLVMLAANGYIVHAQDPPTFRQPIPAELVTGSRYLSTNLVLSRELSPGSKFGFFHLNTNVLDYEDKAESELTMQSLLFFEPIDKFRVTGGVFYATQPGLSPTVGVQYVNPGRNWFVLLAPRVNIEEEPSYSVFSILRYGTDLNDHLGLYASLQALNIFDAEGHIKSYQWLRFGLEAAGTQFGLAFNFDEFGSDPELEFSIGLFVRRELF